MIPLKTAAFLSDIEIDINKQSAFATFQNFLIKLKKINKTPVILGDFFEYYTGKEILSNSQFYGFLLFLKKEMIDLYLIPGNREAIIRNEIEFERNNFHILDKNIEVKTDNNNILLTHGDEILEKEISHLLFKKTMNLVKEHNLDTKIPSQFKGFVGTILRRISRGKKEKNLITSNFYNLNKYDTIIMGHFNEQKEISVKIDGKTTKIYILGKWIYNKPILTYNDGFKWITIASWDE